MDVIGTVSSIDWAVAYSFQGRLRILPISIRLIQRFFDKLYRDLEGVANKDTENADDGSIASIGCRC